MSKIKKNSNIIIIIIFFIMILVPPILFNFVREKIPVDTSENRKLAEKPEFELENIKTYPSDYENYYNDNLPFRSIIRNAWTNFNFYILNECTTTQVLVGKNDGEKALTWLFYQDDSESTNPVKEAQGIETFSDEELLEISTCMDINIEELKNKGIDLYYALIPNKENLYKEKLPNNIIIYEEETRTEKLINYIEEKTDIKNVMYLKSALENAKKENQVYFRQDTHWNNFGAFIGFKEIVNRIDNTYQNFEHNIKVLGNNKKIEQDLSKMSGIKDMLEDTEITVEFLEDVKYEEEVINTDNKIVITKCENAKIDKTLMIVGDSFRVAMIPYFSKIYSKVIYLHRCDYGKYLLELHNPDILVCQCLERYVDTLDNFILY